MAKKRSPWARRLADLQTRLALTNEQMAAKLGVSLRTYVAWKWSERHPPKVAQQFILHLMKS